MFLESVRDFKDIYFLNKPVSNEAFDSALEEEVLVDEKGNTLHHENGEVQKELVSKFPFH